MQAARETGDAGAEPGWHAIGAEGPPDEILARARQVLGSS